MRTVRFNFTGADQTYVVPEGVGSILIQAWGAAGGSSPALAGSGGGPGGYSEGFLRVSPGDALTVIVGQGGGAWNLSTAGITLPTYGGGGGGGPTVLEDIPGNQGGGRSAVRRSTGVDVITAGGGGASGSSTFHGTSIGGPGGGLQGLSAFHSLACYATAVGAAGTQTQGGTGGVGFATFNNGRIGTAFAGGQGGGGSQLSVSSGGGGGGGGGFFGGGGGAGSAEAGQVCPPSRNAQDVAGGGGSGFIGGVTSALTTASPITATTPPNTNSPNYVAGVGVSSRSVNRVGGNGLVVFSLPDPLDVVKSQSNSFPILGETIAYTVAIRNVSATTLNNVIFVDTVPFGTVFVPGSVTLNGSSIAGNPATPGINLGTMAINAVNTVVFQTVVTTIPNPNTLPNTALVNFTGSTIPTSSNTVTARVSQAIINSVKAVDRNFATSENILVYTVTLANSGNTIANNIILKDTIPNGTSFVPNSVRVNGVATNQNPVTGITMPSIGTSGIVTITFNVLVNSTIPVLTPIVNSATSTYTYSSDPSLPNARAGSSNSNIVTTTISTANIRGITKNVDKAFAAVGDVLTYTITLPNTGNTTANNVILVDTIPAGTTFVSNSVFVNGAQTSGDLRPPNALTISSIPAGTTTTVTFQVTVNNSIPSTNPIPNQSTVGFNYLVNPVLNTSANNGGNNSNIVSTTIISTIVSSQKSVDQPSGYVGDPLTYTITLRNTGNTTATNVILIDTIPTATSFIADSITINQVAQPGASIAPPNGISLPNIGINETVTVTFQVLVETIPSSTVVTNIATENYRFVSDPNQVNRSITSNTNIVSTIIYPITNPFKAVNKQFATVGDVLTYIIGWDERSNVQNTNVTFVDTLPNGLTFIPNSVTVNGVSRPGATVTPPSGFLFGTLAAFQSVTLSYQAVVNTVPSPNPIPNDYTVLFFSTLVSGLQSEVSNMTNTQIDLQTITPVSKSVDKGFTTIGETLNYTMTLNNSGNTTLTQLRFVDTIPAGSSFVSNSVNVNGSQILGISPNPPVGILLNSLPLGVNTITFQVKVESIPTSNEIRNIGTFSYEFLIDPITGSSSGGVVNTNTVVSTVNFANLGSPVKAVNKSFTDLPATITYTVTIVNSGNTTATNLIFLDTTPSGTSFVSGSLKINNVATAGDPSSPGVSIPDMRAGGITTVNFDVLVETIPSNNPILNSANIRYQYVVNPLTSATSDGSGNTNIVRTQVNHSDLSGTIKLVDKPFATCGDIITYTIVVPNSGNTAALDIILHDTIPNGTVFVPNSMIINGSPSTNTPDSIDIGNVAAGGVKTVTFQVRVVC